MARKKHPWGKLELADLGGLLHTALRKACDSRTSGLAWNAIGAIEKGWTRYLEDCLPHVQKARNGLELLDALHRHTDVSIMAELKKREHQDLLVRLALAQLSMSDWLGIVYFFEHVGGLR
jgi:hypothetical protein